MCGINGFNFLDKRLLKDMNESIHHRGPDDEGKFFDRKVSLGHKRLSIMDLNIRGKEPMSYSHKGKKAIIVFDGEIYNFMEIKAELILKGYLFENKTDAEVILASYMEWEEKCVNKFNGVWAFCIYDLNKELLFLSRDRLGKKPLYYYAKKDIFIFSSGLKAITQYKQFVKEIDKTAIEFYFSMGFIPSPLSIYKDVNKLEPGQNITFNLKNKKIDKKFYSDFIKYSPIKNKKKLIEEGRKLLHKCTKDKMISDVPIGAFLSGGVDSSSVVGEMIKITENKNINTFSVGFEGRFDESKYINIAKDFFKTKHHHYYFKKKDFNELLEIIFNYYDEPFSDISMFPTFFISKIAKREVSVVLSGDGGDEIFGGYPNHKNAYQVQIIRKILPKSMRNFIMRLNINKKLNKVLKKSLLKDEFLFVQNYEYLPESVFLWAKKRWDKCLEYSNKDIVEASIMMDRHFTTLPDNFLVKVDRASMANALEIRSPFLDYRFIEFSEKIPSKYKTSLFKTKKIMRDIIKDIVPKEILHIKKKGFIPPVEEWLDEIEEIKSLNIFLSNLHKAEIISEDIKEFYNKKVFNKQISNYKGYLIRLFLIKKWLNTNSVKLTL